MLGVRDLIQRNISAGPIVVTAPPECIPELAHALACLLDKQLRHMRVPCVLTCGPGSLPDGSCVPTNIQEAVQARAHRCSLLLQPATHALCPYQARSLTCPDHRFGEVAIRIRAAWSVMSARQHAHVHPTACICREH